MVRPSGLDKPVPNQPLTHLRGLYFAFVALWHESSGERLAMGEFRSNIRITSGGLTAVLSVALLGGCAATGDQPAPGAMGQDVTAKAPANQTAITAQLEADMMIGPASARALGWRPTWTTSFQPDGGVQQLWSTDEGVFVLDGRNELSMLDTDTGLRRWRAFIADPGDQVLDLHVAPDQGLVIVLRSDALVTVNLDTGFPEGPLNGAVPPVQRLEWLARTGGVRVGSDLIYGGLGGEVVWQSWLRGFSSKAHRVGRRMGIAPTTDGEVIIASSLKGTVAALGAGSADLRWSRPLLDRLGGTPAIANDLVYIAGLDQHLRCVSLDRGKPVWTALLTAKLTSAPVVLGDTVYQLNPAEGLTAWEANPADAPDGIRRWTSSTINGNVISSLHDRLLTFDARTGTLATASPTTGAADTTLELGDTTRVQASATRNGRLFVISDAGGIESLVPAR